MEYRVFETVKMKVEMTDGYILKTFKPAHGFQKRYLAEKNALHILDHLDGIPEILEANDEETSIKMTLLPGIPVTGLTIEEAQKVREIITAVIENGVARHSLPIRDILSDDKGMVGIVDFERVTLRDKCDPVTWHVAQKVAYFHLARLLYEHQPSLLSKKDRVAVATGFKIRGVFKKYMVVRDAVRDFYRMMVNPIRET